MNRALLTFFLLTGCFDSTGPGLDAGFTDTSMEDSVTDAGSAAEMRLTTLLNDGFEAVEPFFELCDPGGQERTPPERISCLAAAVPEEALPSVYEFLELLSAHGRRLSACVERAGCDVATNGCEELTPIPPRAWVNAGRSCRE